MALLSSLGLRPLARRAEAAVRPAAPVRAGAKGKAPTAQLEFGAAHIEKMALGPEVAGPRQKLLWAMLAADGSGELSSANSQTGARLNQRGRAVLASFTQLSAREARWLERYAAVQTMAQRSAAALKKMEQAARAVGERSKNRSGEYLRKNAEAYVRAQRAVEDKLRALGPLEEAITQAVSRVHRASLTKQEKAQERDVETAQEAVKDEEKRVEEIKSRLNGLLELAINVVKQDWTTIAEDAAKFVGSQLVDAIPTRRLDGLKRQLEQASANLKNLQDQGLVADMETAAAGLRQASKAMDDAHHDVADAVADLSLAEKTAVEVLGESRSTADAARMVAMKSQMLSLVAQARQAITQYRGEAPALVTDIGQVAELYRSLPGVIRMTPNIDANGAYARSLGAAALENAATLGEWKAYVAGVQDAGQKALDKLADSGETGFLVHFERVGEVLQEAIAGR